MSANYQLKSKQTCEKVFLDIKMFLSTCFMQEAFWINLAVIWNRLIDNEKSKTIATDRSSCCKLIDSFD